jgi:hypothetical protein
MRPLVVMVHQVLVLLAPFRAWALPIAHGSASMLVQQVCSKPDGHLTCTACAPARLLLSLG